MSLTVLEPGPLSLVVDLGRPHHRSLGVPLGGAADRAAYLQGNALVGNEPGTAALEFALVGPTLRADADLACVIFGAPFDAWIDDQPIHIGTTFNLRAGSTLRIGGTAAGLRGYLCVAGGIQAKVILGSRSAFEPLQRHDVLPCLPGSTIARSLGDAVVSFVDANEIVTLRCLPGPQADWFDGRAFFGESFTVSSASDRMGLRLTGKIAAVAGPRVGQRSGVPRHGASRERWAVHHSWRRWSDHWRLSEDCPGHRCRLGSAGATASGTKNPIRANGNGRRRGGVPRTRAQTPTQSHAFACCSGIRTDAISPARVDPVTRSPCRP